MGPHCNGIATTVAQLMFELPVRATRLHAFLTYRHDVLTMPRDVWTRVKPPNREPVLLDLGATPLQGLSEPEVYSIAEQVRGPEYRVSIYRPDIEDAAKGFPINTDHYQLS